MNIDLLKLENCKNYGNKIIARCPACKVAVGTPISRSPPHRSVRAELPHTAPTSSIWRRSVFQDGNALISPSV